MSTQIQQQQVQGLVTLVSGVSANAGNLFVTGSTLSAALAAAEYRLDTDIATVSGDLLTTGAALSGAIVNNTNNLFTTGYLLTIDIENVAADLVTTGATLEAADAVLSGSLVATGATLTTNLRATGTTLTTNLINTGAYLQSEIDALSPAALVGISGAADYANYSLASDFRLNDYVLQTSLTGIPTGTINEASSVCYNPSGCTYLVLSDIFEFGGGSIKEFEFGGTGLVRSTDYILFGTAKNLSQDVEGICHVTGNQFALCSEYRGASKSGAIMLFDYIGNPNLGYTLNGPEFMYYAVPSPYGTPTVNKGLEGISYNPQTQVFYGAFEGDDTNEWKVCEITLGDQADFPSVQAGTGTTVELFSSGTVNFTPALERLSDVYYDPNSKHLFLTDHGTENYPDSDRSRVFECDLAGNFIDYVDLKDSQGNNYNQIEGITFSPDGGRMVIAGEAEVDGVGARSDLGFYTTSSFATSGVYKIPAVMPEGGMVPLNRSLTEADNGTYVHCNGAAHVYLTLPYPNCSGQFDGFQCDIFNEGPGSIYIDAESPGEFKAKGEELVVNYWAKVWCISGVWYGAGDLIP